MLLIDGYNLIFTEMDKDVSELIKDIESKRRRLLSLLFQYNTIKRRKIIVVFDGGKAAEPFPRFQDYFGIKVVFSKPESDADTSINKILEGASNPRSITVVTSDNLLKRSVKKFGAKVKTSSEFYNEIKYETRLREEEEPKIAEPIEKYEGVSEDEVDYWLRYFKIEEDEQ